MAEEIDIIIKAIDETTGPIKDVQDSVNGMAKQTEKAQKSVSESFQQSTGNLIALGNAASTVDNIFSAYTNLQLRLENAAIRVEEAQKNERDAIYNLNKVMSDSEATAEDVAKAKDDLSTASNRVQVAMNNQARAQNAVIGSYINMGVQGLTLLASLPNVWKAVVQLGTGVWSLVPSLYAAASGFLSITIAGAPLWAILLAVIAAIAAIIVVYYKWKDITIWLLDIMLKFAKFLILSWVKIKTAWEVVWASIKNFFISIWNGIIDFLQKAVNKAIDIINKVIRAFNKLPGINIPLVPKVDLGKLQGDLIDVQAIAKKGMDEVSAYNASLDMASAQIKQSVSSKIGYDTAKQEPKTEINITGNNYGTDPTEIGNAIMKNVKNKISI